MTSAAITKDLLLEFSKTRTNYADLVPRVLHVMNEYHIGGVAACPVPVVHEFSSLLNEGTLRFYESQSEETAALGFLALCTERKALRSGGGGKCYFIDDGGRLKGCAKSELSRIQSSGEQRNRSSPVLLKNLVFMFLMDEEVDARLDPRARSSNPQRLLDFYESLVAIGKTDKIRRLLRVWSIEIVPEEDLDYGFPHCSLLWIKNLSVQSMVAKWRSTSFVNQNGMTTSQLFIPQPLYDKDIYTGLIPPTLNNSHTRVNDFHDYPYANFHMSVPQTAPFQSLGAQELLRNYQVASEFLTEQEMQAWCFNIVHSLTTHMIAAAKCIIETTLHVKSLDDGESAMYVEKDRLLLFINQTRKPLLTSVLRILLACLLHNNSPEANIKSEYRGPMYEMEGPPQDAEFNSIVWANQQGEFVPTYWGGGEFPEHQLPSNSLPAQPQPSNGSGENTSE